MLLSSSDTKKNTDTYVTNLVYKHSPEISGFNMYACIYSCFKTQPRENRFQYVRRKYATANNFPCLITLYITWYSIKKQKVDWNQEKLIFKAGLGRKM